MKLYVAGPMSGIPQFNFPAFFAAGDKLRELGYEVVNPAELDDEEDKGAAMKSKDGKLGTGTGGIDKTWGDFLMRDVKLIADIVDGICVLPNWHKSRGARLETFCALQVQKPVFFLDEGEVHLFDPKLVMTLIAMNTVIQGDTSHYEVTA